MALSSSLQSPVDGIYTYDQDLPRLSWPHLVETAKANPSAIAPNILTVVECCRWWHMVRDRYGDLVFCNIYGTGLQVSPL